MRMIAVFIVIAKSPPWAMNVRYLWESIMYKTTKLNIIHMNNVFHYAILGFTYVLTEKVWYAAN